MQIKLTTIIYRQSGRQTRKVETFEGPKLSFGRSASNDVVLSDRSLPVKCFDLDIVDGVVGLRATDNQTKVSIDGIDLKRPEFLSGESQAEFKVGQYSISLGLSADQDMVLVSIDPGGSVGYTPRYGPGFRVRSKFANLLKLVFCPGLAFLLCSHYLRGTRFHLRSHQPPPYQVMFQIRRRRCSGPLAKYRRRTIILQNHAISVMSSHSSLSPVKPAQVVTRIYQSTPQRCCFPIPSQCLRG